jgi:hypothetical protein
MKTTATPPMSAPAQPEPKLEPLYGWTAGALKSPRLFAEKWLADRAARNRRKRHGDTASLQQVHLPDAEQHAALLAEARRYGNVQRPGGVA